MSRDLSEARKQVVQYPCHAGRGISKVSGPGIGTYPSLQNSRRADVAGVKEMRLDQPYVEGLGRLYYLFIYLFIYLFFNIFIGV